MYSRSAWLDSWTAHEEGNADVEFEWKALALNQSKLTQVVSVVRSVNYICVVQLPEILQLLVDTLDGHVYALQSL